jgi:NAD(P)-dependent dehydrogenase (short-subunit alcohol dehydrogenase family)
MKQVALVTGATGSIGKATAAALAAQGLAVIVAGRDREKTERTVRWIQSETGNETIDYLLADFSDLNQVRALATSVQERYPRLDVLINNAGAYYSSRQDTPYGVERTFLVNYLAPFLLTDLLLDRLRESAPARIVNVSSEAHRSGALDFEHLGSWRGYVGFRAYARSKLALVLSTYELARRLEGCQVTVNALHPGYVATDIVKNDWGWLGPIIKWVMGWFSETPKVAAERLVYLAISPQVEGITGRYFVKRAAVASAPLTYDQEVAQRLWRVSEAMIAG